MSTLVLKVFVVKDQSYALMHSLIDDSRTVASMEGYQPIYHINSSMEVTDVNNKLIAYGGMGKDSTWHFTEVENGTRFETGHGCTERAEVAFAKHLLEQTSAGKEA